VTHLKDDILPKRQAVAPWIEKAARVGYATKGLVYALIGALAAAAALRSGGETTDTQGALEAVLRQPFGALLTGLVGAGLAAYAAWRFTQGLWDTEGKGADAKGGAIRFGYCCSGLLHAGLAASAFKLVVGLTQKSEHTHRDATVQLLAMPFGRYLVAAVGIGVLAFALAQVRKAYRQKFRDHLKTEQMSANEKTWMLRWARFGLVARGIVFGIVGWFFARAAWKHDPNEAGGLKEALRTVENAPYGPWLLGVVAAGLISYGLYMFVEARFHRISAR